MNAPTTVAEAIKLLAQLIVDETAAVVGPLSNDELAESVAQITEDHCETLRLAVDECARLGEGRK